MSLFTVFVLFCVAGGVFFWNKRLAARNVVTLLACLFLAFAYFFLNQL